MMEPFIFLIALLVIGLILYFSNRKLLNKDNPESLTEDSRPSREHLRELILGKRKRSVIHKGSRITTNNYETRVVMFKESYRFGKLFELASKSPNNSLKLSNGDSISPHSREHGLESGKNADRLRIKVLKEFGIDIATMEDLEVGDEEFTARRTDELIRQIESGLDDPSGPTDDDGFSKEG